MMKYTHVVDRYMRQVLDETMRCSLVATYAARFQDIDIELGGHKVPAGVSFLSLITEYVSMGWIGYNFKHLLPLCINTFQ